MMGQPEEIPDADHEQTIERVCAIDVAKAPGKVCTRVPHPSRPGARRTRVWDVDATTNAILGLGRVPWIFAAGSCRSVRCLIS